MPKLLKSYKVVIFLLILIIPTLWALFVPGFFGASDELHIAWLYEMFKTISLGQIPPRYVPDLSYGFGYPLYNFVFPLPFYVGSFLHLLGLSFVDSVKGVFFISIILAALAMYRLLREFTDEYLSLAGAVLYAYTPYRAVDLYIRGAIGEIFSFIFLPLIALATIKLTDIREEEKGLNFFWMGMGALSLAGLILTHNITAFMFFPFVLLLGVVRLLFLSKSKGKSLVQSLIFILLGVGISAYFWIPAIIDSNLMKYDTVFNYVDHFPTLKQLVTPYWGYGASVPGPYDGMSFYLGTGSLLAFVFSVGYVLITRGKKISRNEVILLGWVGISLGITIFMMNFRSSFLWDSLPLIPYFQFPWRFLVMTTFLIPLTLVVFRSFKHSRVLALLIIAITLATSFTYFRPQDFLGRQDDYFLNKYIPIPVASKEYQQVQEEYLRLPQQTSERPSQLFPRVLPTQGVVQIKELNALDSEITTSSQSDFQLNYTKYAYPGWYATIDGQNAMIKPAAPYGQISVTVPSGAHTVKIGFKETPFKLGLDILSLIVLILTLGFIFKDRLKHPG